MKLLSILSLAVASASALPVADPLIDLLSILNDTRNDVENGDASVCPSVILIFGRGTFETGNMGNVVGPSIAKAMDEAFPNDIWIQGVGSPYLAQTQDNYRPKGTTQEAIDEAKRLFDLASSKCPDATIVTGGYSQGSAVVGSALTESSPEMRDRVAGAVLFGYTQNKQNNGRIPDYPVEKTMIYCETGDVICDGILLILPSHILYADDASGPATDFLRNRIAIARG